ncbi:MAG: SDR family oxidoreductase [Bacteroidetes bacterium]|nr:SDR family oxidoreductase [Bacteroidota bacterium]
MNIIVTGSSKGIGLEIVKSFASYENSKVIAIARNELSLLRLKEECSVLFPNSTIIPMPFDLSVSAFRTELQPRIQKYFSKIDILINNAGKMINKPFELLTEYEFDTLMDVNLKSAFKMIKVCLPMMHKGSHIVNIGSMGGVQGSAKFPGLSLYSASKGALAILSECLAEELKEKKISVNCLALGAVQTEMLQSAFPGYVAPNTPEQMASFITNFAMTGAQFFNGKILPVSISTP